MNDRPSRKNLPAIRQDKEEIIPINEDSPSEDEGYNHAVYDHDHSDADVPSPRVVIARIEGLMCQVLEQLDQEIPPYISTKSFFHSTHCRSLTSILLVASFCHSLLQSHRTTTTRDVYYYFVTHFRVQKECDTAIWDLAAILQVPRSSLGLAASPKGWFCGCIDIYNARGDLIVNGRELDVHGMAITSTSAIANRRSQVVRSLDAKCILVIEKEGVYNRLSQDKFFLQYPSILITGKGFPDVATRRWVQLLQQQLQLPVYGLCDCNPYGISVLHTYHYAEVSTSSTHHHQHTIRSSGTTRPQPKLDMRWIGLRPSQIKSLQLPPNVLQQLTELDHKRLTSLTKETHPFHQHGNRDLRLQELHSFEYKVELEALNWKGMDFLCIWLKDILIRHECGSNVDII